MILSVFFFCLYSNAQEQKSIKLSGKWKVTWNDGNHGPNNVDAFININPLTDTLRYFEVDVPKDLNLVMKEKKLVGDLNTGTNYLSARWVAEQYWQYYKVFSVPEEILDKNVELRFDRLDYKAKIFLNGQYVGEHENAFIPYVVDVTNKLKAGDNIITVGIESGLYNIADKNITDYNNSLNVSLNKRPWLRKPQYQFSWDWNPFLINVGITDDVSLVWYDYAKLNNIVPLITMSEDLSSANILVRSFIKGVEQSDDLSIDATLLELNQKVSKSFLLKKGTNPYELEMKVDNPELWWPIGHGDQSLYTLKVDIKSNGKIIDTEFRKIGFRKIEIDRSKHPVEGNFFTVKVNNRPIFMKGGNWVPADMIYSNVTKTKLEKLVDLALEANFNTIRIWGGGLYAGNELLSMCDEKGLLVWHDFLFACSKYPGDNVEFYKNIRNEVTWGVREFAYHPSLIIWAGNNENEWGLHWGYDSYGKVVPDYAIYHHLIPNILKNEDPSKFYWPSSPYSENNVFPNSPITGDQHPWGVTLMEDSTDFWAYREYEDRFPNEGGVLGASTLATLKQFIPEDEMYIRSFTWDQHDNSKNFEIEGEGVTYRFVEDWLGVNYQQMELNDYVFASGLIQSEGLSEYINNYRRRMFSSSCAIFWMYNDSWPVTHGWTIIDYYLRKKLAYFPVKRVFNPISVVVANDGDRINVYGINEKNERWSGKLQYGVFNIKGGKLLNNSKNVTIPSNSSTILASFDRNKYKSIENDNHGVFAVLSKENELVSQHRLFLKRFKDLSFSVPEIEIKYSDDKATFISPVFVWGVCLDIDGESEVQDNCFDLIPGVPYTVNIKSDEKLSVKMTGNDLMMELRNVIK